MSEYDQTTLFYMGGNVAKKCITRNKVDTYYHKKYDAYTLIKCELKWNHMFPGSKLDTVIHKYNIYGMLSKTPITEEQFKEKARETIATEQAQLEDKRRELEKNKELLLSIDNLTIKKAGAQP